MEAASCLLGLGQAVAGSGTIRFWGACGVGVADESTSCGNMEVAVGIVSLSHYIFWGEGIMMGGCIPRPMQMIESGSVSAVAVSYLSVAAK